MAHGFVPRQGVVTTIPAVLTPATGDPVPLRTPQKVGGHLRILQIGQKINDFSSWNQAIKKRSLFSVNQAIKGICNRQSSDQGLNIYKADQILIPVAGVSTAGIVVTTPCQTSTLLVRGPGHCKVLICM